MSNKIELKSISELQGMNFFIPDYQRGYRWTKQQVKDLLNDIQEFIDKKRDGFYCIQPLVVRKSLFKSDEVTFKQHLEEIKLDSDFLIAIEKLLINYTKWEVIDGQQRLTTIYILLAYLDYKNWYSIEYETRPGSKIFLSEIDENRKEENIDYFHIVEAKEQIDNWFIDKSNEKKDFFKDTLIKNVKFIWYESIEEDPIKVFTRLNIGKIPLTNAELIKALFLNKSNFKDSDFQKIRLQQQEIASEWDTIEYTLQNDEFWLFLNEKNYEKPTRIDFIFDLICEKDILKLQSILNLSDKNYNEELGSDEFRTFRYFYFWFKQNNIEILKSWKEVKTLFQTFQEWFNDLELYHYIGYLIEYKIRISDIVNEWNKPHRTKKKFLAEYIIPEIKKKISQSIDLDKQYEIKGNPKTQCRPILLLHNIQTVIIQNKNITENEKYKLPVFYKFPFHLFKKEQWDIEHIDSNTENLLENENEQKEWLKASSIGLSDIKLQEDIKLFLSKEGENDAKFEELQQSILKSTSFLLLTDNEKDKLWNFTLLDVSTNRGYGNAIFPAKRRVIISKDQGKYIKVDDELNVTESDGAIAFIPPCTKNVFLKYFNSTTNNIREWDKVDAKAYLNNIKTVLKDFLT